MIIHELYYALSRLKYRPSLKFIGKKVKLRLDARFICGKYISIDDLCEFTKGCLMAVYPEFPSPNGKVNPVKNNKKGILLGKHVTANRNLTIYCADSVEIEDNVMMGSDILITDNDHGMEVIDDFFWQQPLKTAPVKIGQGSWICDKCTIIKGARIGKKCIIGANSLVNSYIPDYTIAVGTPAVPIKRWNFEKGKWEKVQESL